MKQIKADDNTIWTPTGDLRFVRKIVRGIELQILQYELKRVFKTDYQGEVTRWVDVPEVGNEQASENS